MFKYQSSFLFHFQVKPARAGSSIGVKVAYGVLDSLTKADEIISEVCWFSWDLTVRLDQKFANLIENVLKLTWKWHFLFWKFKGKHVNWSICIEMNWKFSITKSFFFFFSKFWALKSSSQYILSFKDFLFAIFDRELMTKSLLKYFLKEGVSLQPLSWMWGLVWIAILLCYCQLRYELFQCLFSSD